MNRSSGTLQEQLQALLVAGACALLFLGSAVRPDRALVPYAPELLEPAWSELAASDPERARELLRLGSTSQGDKYGQSLAWDRTTEAALEGGELPPAWTDTIAGGAAFVPQMAQPFEPWNLLLLVPSVSSTGWYGLWWLLHIAVFGLLGYRFTRHVVGVHDHRAALFGVVVLCLGLWCQARIHHNVMLSAALPVFPMLGSVHDLFHRRTLDQRLRSGAVLSVSVGLAWLGGFPPAALMASYAAGGYGICLALSSRGFTARQRLQPLTEAATAAGLGLAISAPQLLPTLTAAAQTARVDPTAAELLSQSLSLRHLLTLVWPDLLHWPGSVLDASPLDEKRAWAATLLLPVDKALSFNHTETAYGTGVLGTFGLLLAGLGLARRTADRRSGLYLALLAFCGLGIAMAITPLFEITGVMPGARAGATTRFLFWFACTSGPLAAVGFAAIEGRTARLLGLAFAAAVGLLSLPMLAMAFCSDDTFLDLCAWLAAHHEELGAAMTAEQARAYFVQLAGDSEAETNRMHLAATGLRALLAAAGLASVLSFSVLRRRAALACALVAALELLHAGSGPVVAVERGRVDTRPPILEPVARADLEARRNGDPRPRICRLLVGPKADLMSYWFLPPNLPAFYGFADLAAYNPLPPVRMVEFNLAIEPDRPGKPSAATAGSGGAGVRGFFDPTSLDHPLLDVIGATHALVYDGGEHAVSATDSLVERTPLGVPAPFRIFERTTSLAAGDLGSGRASRRRPRRTSGTPARPNGPRTPAGDLGRGTVAASSRRHRQREPNPRGLGVWSSSSLGAATKCASACLPSAPDTFAWPTPGILVGPRPSTGPPSLAFPVTTTSA